MLDIEQIEQIDSKKTLEEIKQLMKLQLMFMAEAWSVDVIAAYFNQSRITTRDNIVSHPSFPPPRKIGTSTRRWHAKEVRAYFERAPKVIKK